VESFSAPRSLHVFSPAILALIASPNDGPDPGASASNPRKRHMAASAFRPKTASMPLGEPDDRHRCLKTSRFAAEGV
jgi:hypothetical protein